MRVRLAGAVIGSALACTTVLGFGSSASASSADDVKIAEAGTILASDLPAAYSETTSASSQIGVEKADKSSLEGSAADIKECKGFVEAFGGKPEGVTASADGAQFEDEATQVSGSVLVFQTEAQARALYKPLAKRSLATCMDKLFKKSFEESIASGSQKVEIQKATASVKAHPVPAVGDETSDYQITLSMKAAPKNKPKQAITVDMTGDLQFVRAGRTLAFYNFLAVGGPLDDVQQPAVAAATARLAAAQGG